MVLYIFAKILFKLVEVILLLPPVLLVLHLTLLTLSIICTTPLSITKRFISQCNRAISTKTGKTSFNSQTGNIGRANLNLKANITTNLALHLELLFKLLFNAKDVLYVVKKMLAYKSLTTRAG